MPPEPFDYLLVGGGLQNSLIALALLGRDAGVRVCLVERGRELGGNHLWCFHAADLSPAGEALVAPLVIKRWDGYSVRFPRFERRLESPYAAVSSERLARVVRDAFSSRPESHLMLEQGVREVLPNAAVLDSGAQIHARMVIDARGPEAHAPFGVIGYQKFIGLELELERPTTLSEPVVMDATIEQEDGFRFVYTLPLTPSRVLVEDTYFSDQARLDSETLSQRVLAYAEHLGLHVARVVRRESGVLPLTSAALPVRAQSPLLAGYAGGWFHPTTGYSFPVATRLALEIASRTPETLFDQHFGVFSRAHQRQQRYAFLLNRLLFRAMPEGARRNVLERFYQLPEATIARFYALSTTPLDRARILCGRPPRGLSLGRALSQGLLA